jgi:DNA modification methylase
VADDGAGQAGEAARQPPDPEAARALDSFNGSGTTGVAALRLGRSYVGIDLEPGYLALTRKRIEAEIELPRPRATLRVASR